MIQTNQQRGQGFQGWDISGSLFTLDQRLEYMGPFFQPAGSSHSSVCTGQLLSIGTKRT